MAGFSYQQPPFLLDSVILPNTPMKMPGLLEKGDTHTTCFSYYPSEPFHEVSVDVRVHNEICPDNSTRVRPYHNEPSILEKQQNTDSSSVVIEPEISDQVIQKKKNRSGSCSISAQSKDANEGKFKKQRKCSSTIKDTEKKQLKAEKKKVDEGTPTAYIHVRARRGQATDSHSLAERVRREKINDRMKLLQGLVPGCDKVTGKVLKLDEIINYIQSLQNQVEFLSMKLASVNPMFYDFGGDLDAFMKPGSFASPSPSVQVCSPAQTTILAENTTTFATTNNYPTLDTSLAMLVQQGQSPNAFSQENGNLSWNMEDHRQRLINQSGLVRRFNSKRRKPTWKPKRLSSLQVPMVRVYSPKSSDPSPIE